MGYQHSVSDDYMAAADKAEKECVDDLSGGLQDGSMWGEKILWKGRWVTDEELKKEREAGLIQAEREQCCKDACERCAGGMPVFQDDFGVSWHKEDQRYDSYCDATGIRERAWKEKQ